MTELKAFNDFCEDACLNQNHNIERRPDNIHMVECLIIDCKDGWWYQNHIGVKFLGIIHYDRFRMRHPLNPNKDINIIKSIQTFKLVGNTKILYGRDLEPEHIQIL